MKARNLGLGSLIMASLSVAAHNPDALTSQCGCLSRSGIFPVECGEYAVAHPSSWTLTPLRLTLGDWYFYRADYQGALGQYRMLSASEFSGDVKEGYIYRYAYSLIKCGYYEDARPLLRQLSGSDGYADAATFYQAYIDYVGGDYDKAYDGFKKVRAKGERGLEAEYYINQIEFRRGEYHKVTVTSERLLSPGAAPDILLPETMRVAGISYFKLGNTAAARNILRRYVSETADNAEVTALYTLGAIYYDEGNYTEALPLFLAVTDLGGDLAQSAWLYLGQIYLRRGDGRAAALAFDKASREKWNDEVAEVAAYNLAVSSADGLALPFSDSAAAMEEFIDTYPASPYAGKLAGYLANAYYNRHDYATALRHTDRLPATAPETRLMRQKIQYRLGVQQFTSGKVPAAIESLTAASAATAPDRELRAQAALWLGDAFYTRKDYAAAARAYKAAIADGISGANKSTAYYNLGYAYMKMGNYREAEKAFRSADPTPDATLRLADCLYYTGKYADAYAIFSRMQSEPGQTGVYASVRVADILGREGKVGEKIAVLEELERAGGGELRSTVLRRLADAYSEQGHDAKAAQVYSRLLAYEKEDDARSQTYYSLATNAANLYRIGDYEAAYEIYRQLEQSGMAQLQQEAVIGVMRTSPSDAEVADYAVKVLALPALAPEVEQEAKFVIASQYLKAGQYDEAESRLLALIDAGVDDNYLLAEAYIALADVYIAQEKCYLAKMYLETLRDNYPGTEKEILDAINSRLRLLK